MKRLFADKEYTAELHIYDMFSYRERYEDFGEMILNSAADNKTKGDYIIPVRDIYAGDYGVYHVSFDDEFKKDFVSQILPEYKNMDWDEIADNISSDAIVFQFKDFEVIEYDTDSAYPSPIVKFKGFDGIDDYDRVVI